MCNEKLSAARSALKTWWGQHTPHRHRVDERNALVIDPLSPNSSTLFLPFLHQTDQQLPAQREAVQAIFPDIERHMDGTFGWLNDVETRLGDQAIFQYVGQGGIVDVKRDEKEMVIRIHNGNPDQPDKSMASQSYTITKSPDGEHINKVEVWARSAEGLEFYAAKSAKENYVFQFQYDDTDGLLKGRHMVWLAYSKQGDINLFRERPLEEGKGSLKIQFTAQGRSGKGELFVTGTRHEVRSETTCPYEIQGICGYASTLLREITSSFQKSSQ